MKSFSEQFSKYNQQYNQQKNKLMQYTGIPCVILGLFILLSWMSIGLGEHMRVNFAWLLLIFTVTYYYLLGVYKLGAITAVLMLLLLFIAQMLAGSFPPSFLSSILFLILLGGGLGLLLFGHIIEKSKIALMETFLQIMVTPLFLVSDLLEACGLSKIIK